MDVGSRTKELSSNVACASCVVGQVLERLLGLKRRRVWIIAIGDCALGRGEYLDEDVPIVTPIVQQAEQAANAADAHMTLGKMEVISRAAAKMTNSAAAGELAGAEL